MSLTNKRGEIPPGLKNRPGLNGNERLPSINSLVNRLNKGSLSSSPSVASSFLKSSSLANNQLTRGGVTKRVFKPNIPLKLDRTREADNEQTGTSLENQLNNNEKNKKISNGKSMNDFKNKNLKNKKELIQIEGTLEGFKVEPKSRALYSNGYASTSTGFNFATKNENHLNGCKKIKFEGSDLKKEKDEKSEIKKARLASDEDYLSDDDLEDDLSLNDEDMPISWANYSKMINQFNNLTNEKNNVEEKLESGRLILMPCIFGNVTGDTGYKLQVLKSGKMRLVDKKSGFTVDLLNTGNLEHDAIKEVVELDDDKLLRYGSLKNMDIYSPVRNLDSDYNLILQD